MRAPAFWWRASSPLSILLRPASLAYGFVAGRRMRRGGAHAEVPVVCIGNFTAGGAGKTPTAIAVAGLMRAMGEAPVFLSRGYGGTRRGPIRVTDPDTAAEVGDEPLLLAAFAPTIVSRDRPAGAALAARQGATVIVMDDGLQNPSLAKDLSLAVVDGAAGIGNGLPLPAGPLRAPMRVQWRKVDAVLVIGPGPAGERVMADARARGVPAYRGRLVPDPAAATRLKGQRVLAFAGIGRPDKFFETLAECGATVEVARAFPDHHAFTAAEIAGLHEEAKARGLHLVTTEKDAARLAGSPMRSGVLTLPVHLHLDDPGALRTLLSSALAAARSREA